MRRDGCAVYHHHNRPQGGSQRCSEVTGVTEVTAVLGGIGVTFSSGLGRGGGRAHHTTEDEKCSRYHQNPDEIAFFFRFVPFFYHHLGTRPNIGVRTLPRRYKVTPLLGGLSLCNAHCASHCKRCQLQPKVELGTLMGVFGSASGAVCFPVFPSVFPCVLS